MAIVNRDVGTDAFMGAVARRVYDVGAARRRVVLSHDNKAWDPVTRKRPPPMAG